MFILSLYVLNLILMNEKLKKLFSFLTIFIAISSIQHQALAISTESEINQMTCESYALNSEIEDRYKKIKQDLENDFTMGLPYKLRTQLVGLRSETDHLSQKLFNVTEINNQEINALVKETVDRLEKFIQLLPEISENAPKLRIQYVVPFTNLSSLRAEHQECLMTLAIQQAKSDAEKDSSQTESVETENVYTQLTNELNSLSANLYKAETSDVQKFIHLRAELINALEQYNRITEEETSKIGKDIVKNIPVAINAVQTEIERLLPGLKLSKNYYSILN